MTLFSKFDKLELILASQSPRRQHLLKELGIPFTIKVKSVDEVFPSTLKREEIPLYLAKLKAKAFEGEIQSNQILITADTIVWLNDSVLEKPANFQVAFSILRTLSGKKHTVYTGVCIKSNDKETSFWASTDVYFKELTDDEIHYYVENFKPYDKAGAYGIQEWIGYIGIKHIEGSYFNVMGLPIQKLYDQLLKF